MKEFFTNFSFVGMDFYTMTCVMLFYSFLGWLYESTIFSLGEQGKFMDRGCFIGPVCPIYSIVSLASLYLFRNVASSLAILLLSGLTTCVIEYFTSVVMEKLFHKRYWDYSYYPLNIDGRVSVVSGLFFGVALLFMIKVIHPMTISLLDKFPGMARYVIAIGAWSLFFADAVWTTIGNMTKNNRIKTAYDTVVAWKQSQFDRLNKRKEKWEGLLIVRAGKKVLQKGKELNRKAVDFENKVKGKNQTDDQGD